MVQEKTIKNPLGAGAKLKLTVEQIKDAMFQAKGFKSVAAQMLGVTIQTITNYERRHPELVDYVNNEVKESLYDMVEAQILSEIKKGNTSMIIFYAKTKMKHRGYSTNDVYINNNFMQQINNIDFRELSDEQLQRIAAGNLTAINELLQIQGESGFDTSAEIVNDSELG